MVVTASTGVAATLLLRGRTAHSAFRIPIGCDSEDVPLIKGHEAKADRLRAAKVIIIDEVTMVNKDIFLYIDRTLRSLYNGPEKDLPFAGKVICISGDWKQRLPIVRGEKRPAVVAATLKRCDLYHMFETLPLTHNMRVDASEIEFMNWCRATGNGTNYVEPGSELTKVLDEMLLSTINEMYDFAFPPDLFTDPISSMPYYSFCTFIIYNRVLGRVINIFSTYLRCRRAEQRRHTRLYEHPRRQTQRDPDSSTA